MCLLSPNRLYQSFPKNDNISNSSEFLQVKHSPHIDSETLQKFLHESGYIV